MSIEMKATMFSKDKVVYLFTHVFDGFKGSYEGIVNLKQQGLVNEEEYVQLLEKNHQRLIDRIKEFRAAEKMLCVFFAMMFTWMQVSDQDLEMRRARRTRVRRKNESGCVKIKLD
jgi:hypothetical protein